MITMLRKPKSNAITEALTAITWQLIASNKPQVIRTYCSVEQYEIDRADTDALVPAAGAGRAG